MYQTSQEYKDLVYADSTKHLLNIYIDGNEVSQSHILNFKMSHSLFSNNEFSLGGVESRSIEFQIYKDSLPETYSNIYVETGIEDEIVPIGYFILDSISKDDEYTVTVKAIDYMLKFEFNYDGSKLNYPTTLKKVLDDICKKAGVELGSNKFINSESQIVVYDNTVTAREYISYIAELAGGYAFIGRDGKLYIKTIGENTEALSINYFQNFSWGEKFKLSRVAYEDGIQDFKVGDEENNTIWINQNNMYVVSKEQIQNIYDYYKNFECYSFKGDVIIDPALDIGDILIIDNKAIIYQGDIEYKGKFKASISSEIRAKEQEETTSRQVSQKTINRRVQSQIDQENLKITQLVEETTEHEEKIVQHEQDINGLKQSVSNTIDYKREIEGITELHIEDAGQADILMLEVKGNKTYDANLFPSEDLYPSESLLPNVEGSETL